MRVGCWTLVWDITKSQLNELTLLLLWMLLFEESLVSPPKADETPGSREPYADGSCDPLFIEGSCGIDKFLLDPPEALRLALFLS